MNKILTLFFAAIFVLTVNLNAENDGMIPNVPAQATLSGIVVDQLTGEALAGATVCIEGTDTKTYTDLEGRFSLTLKANSTYNVKVDYISYQETTLSNVKADSKAGDLKIRLSLDEN
jgi:hypothetical protein